MQRAPAAVLFYDGLCGFCDSTVQFVLARDKTGTLRFATLQGEFARAFFARHPALRNIDSIILVQSPDSATENVHVLSSAILALCKYLGGVWRPLGAMLGIVPRFLRDGAYRLFARVRYRVFGRLATCRIPEAGQRARFID